MNLVARISSHFDENARLNHASADILSAAIARAVELMVQALASDRKILVCGNGGSAAAAQQLTAGLVGRFERERPELAAIALSADSSLITATASDSGFDEIFSRQVRGLGMAGDVLVGVCGSGNSPNVLAAIASAHERGMQEIGRAHV